MSKFNAIKEYLIQNPTSDTKEVAHRFKVGRPYIYQVRHTIKREQSINGAEIFQENVRLKQELDELKKKTLGNELSDKERVMFTKLGYEPLFNSPINVEDMYRMAILECFFENKQGEAVDSLRKAGEAFLHRTIVRHTEAFDNLI